MGIEELDITGQKFGKLTATERDRKNKKHVVYWLFKCDCGITKSMQKSHVMNGIVHSCGCSKSKAPLNLLGKKYYNLTVLEYAYTDKNHRTCWKCICACGKECIIRGSSMTSGTTKSCGCLSKKYKRRNESTEGYELGLRKVYSSYRRNAIDKKRSFELDIDEFKDITSRNCVYCGSSPETVSCAFSLYTKEKYSFYYYNGIDRINSNGGYTKDNIVPCCQMCNRMKMNYTVEKFYEHINKIYNYKQEVNNAKSKLI